jgi:hypothetical protein
MFTTIACFGVAAIAWLVMRQQTKESVHPPSLFDDARVRESVVHGRQDLRLIAYFLGAIFVMLGIIADRVH